MKAGKRKPLHMVSGIILEGKPKCPHCGYEVDRTVSVNERRVTEPTPGAVNICPQCTKISLFDDMLMLREATEEEMEELKASPQRELIEKLQSIISQNPWPREAAS